MSQTYTHKDLARKLKVSETTIKSYRRKFPECIPVASQGKPIRFLPEAVAVCMRIRDLFDLGMSVEEVRARLSEEFPWVSLINNEKEPPQQETVALPQEFTTAFSNMAKTMVVLLQKQTAITERMEKLERVLEDVKGIDVQPRENGVQTADFKAVLEDLQGYLRNALMPLQQLQRLNDIQGITEMLHQAASNMMEAAQIMRGLADRNRPSEDDAGSSKVVPFPSTAALQHASVAPPPPQEPPRAFLLKPMIIRTAEGAYIGAGGKGRGRFSLNDFKALLVYGRRAGESFSLQWKFGDNEWTAVLTRSGAEGSSTWHMQLQEVVAQSGMGAVELIGFAVNSASAHPTEFVGFIDSLAEGA